MKAKISVSIDTELVKWIENQVATQKFRNKSHVVEVALLNLKKGKF